MDWEGFTGLGSKFFGGGPCINHQDLSASYLQYHSTYIHITVFWLENLHVKHQAQLGAEVVDY